MVHYLQKYGHTVLDNGYEVVGITPGTKHPSYDYSVEALPQVTHKHLEKLLSNGHARDGVGIRTRFTPMFDIDITHEQTVTECVADAEEIIGLAPSRIGQSPKIGLIYRSTDPFKKVTSKAFVDPDGNKAQVEFLGDGQQFVALAIHPDTKKKYTWPDKGWNPVRMKHEELLIVTQEQALEVANRFEQRCIDRGWKRWKSKKTGTALTTMRRERDPDDLLSGQPCGLSIEEVRNYIERLNNDDSVEYESDDFDSSEPNYRNIIFAIWHETDGSEEGKEIAREWSEKSPKHEQEEGRFEKLWGSADPGERTDAVTFRYIIKLVRAQEEDEKRELRDGHLDSLRACTDADDLKTLAKLISKTKFDKLDTERLAHALKAAMTRITGVALPISAARAALYHAPTDDDLPLWIKPWRYIENSMRFFNYETGTELEHKAFDAKFSRELGGASAVEYALNQAKIKTYYVPMYKPDEDEDFIFDGKECINTFSERLMPSIPEKYSKKDLIAIATIEAHIHYMIPDARERGIFLSWFAHIVRTRSRPNWAVVLKGTQGDGKSFFFEMMGAVLGSNNVRMLDAAQLEDKYTAWAQGQLLTCIAELRMEGHNRYNILNRVKPFITDNAVNIHPKNVNPYTAFNTTAYFATTNHANALPIDDNDRRWLILYSAWKSGDQIKAFEKANPGYFDILFDTLNRAGAIRKWLTDYKLHPEFKPRGRAPETRARIQMVNLSKNELQIEFEEIIKEDTHPQISTDLVISSALVKFFYEKIEETVNSNTISKFLSENGYEKLTHRVRLSRETDNKESVWVRDRSRFNEKDTPRQRRDVSLYLRDRQKFITHAADI